MPIAFHTVTRTIFIINKFLHVFLVPFNKRCHYIRQMDYIYAETQFLWQHQIVA